jgi:flagellar basal body-associated protein FliL
MENPLGSEAKEQGRDTSRTTPELDLLPEKEVVDSRRNGTEPESAPEQSVGDILKDRNVEEIVAGPDKLKSPVRKKNAGRRIGLFILILTGISLLLVFGYFHLKYDLLGLNNKKIEALPEKRHFPIFKEETITFDSFIVPFRENKKFTYISLSIVFRLPNKEIRREISRKREYLRGILYDMFTEEINRVNNIPPIDHLKESIIRTVNRALSTGAVKEVFITQFLAV